MDRLRGCVLGLAGGVLLLVGAAVPAHFRAVSTAVLQAAAASTGAVGGRSGDASVNAVAGGGWGPVVDRLLEGGRWGMAGLVLKGSRELAPSNPAIEERFRRWEAGRRESAGAVRWGMAGGFLERSAGRAVSADEVAGRPVLGWALREEVRKGMAKGLAASSDPSAAALVACRELEGTRILPAVRSAAGQPMEAALLVAGGLAVSGRMHPGLALEFERAAVAARQGRGTERLETGLLDVLGAARHLDWDQLGGVMEWVPNLGALHAVVNAAGAGGERWPVLSAAMALEGGGGGVPAYLVRHGLEALDDVRLAATLGEPAVRELVRRGWRVERGGVSAWLSGWKAAAVWTGRAGEFALRQPGPALAVRYGAWLAGVFLMLVGVVQVFRRAPAGVEEDGGGRAGRTDYGVLGVLAVTAGVLMFLVSERFVFTKSGLAGLAGTATMPVLRLRLRTDIPQVTGAAMNEKIIGMLVVFFALQFVIYLVALGRLRQVRGQDVEDAVKLKLLDNEESMFDAPLYLGIAGSVLALVLRLMGFDDVSLMASYSSTLFGILFCFLLKVVHVRPYRRQLILESSAREQRA